MSARHLRAGLLPGDQPVPGEPGLPHQPGPLTPGGAGRRRQQGERSEEVRVHPGADVSSSPRLTAGEHCLTVILMSQY